MRIEASIGAGIKGRSQQPSVPLEEAPQTAKASLPAVIPMKLRPALERRPQIRPLATVIAQLAAVAGDHPSTRARRRAEPFEGANLYGLATAVTPQAPQTTIRIL